MTKDPEVHIAKPFGPSIAKVTIPKEIILTLNNYVDDIINDEKKSKAQDFGGKLVGQVTQEFQLETKFIETSGWLEFLGKAVSIWVQKTNGQVIKEFTMRNSWIVRQYKNEYNPAHWHGGHISGVGYLKVPNTFGAMPQQNKKDANKNGKLELIHGTRQFLSNSLFNVTPKVGDFYLFPNYLMHMVYPFSDTDEERRSISFNADIDEKIYNVYGS